MEHYFKGEVFMKSSFFKLLLVEDDHIDQMAFKRAVKREELPYDFMIASSVKEAKEHLMEKNFDVVITDYFLGDGTSFELFEHLKNIPTIVTTGTGDEEVAVKAMKMGAYDYLIKDSDRNYLKVLPLTVEKAVKQKRDNERLVLLESALSTETSNGVIIIDSERNIEWVNKGFLSMSLFSMDDIIGSNGSHLRAEESIDLFEKNLESVFSAKTPLTYETKNRRKNNEIYWSLANLTPVINKSGNVDKIILIESDITEKKEAEFYLKESKKKYEQIVESASDIIYRTDNKGNFNYINPVGLRILQIEEKEILGKYFLEIVRDDYRERVRGSYAMELNKGKESAYIEFPLKITNPEKGIWIGQNIQSLFEKEKFIGYQAVSRDITERKKAERALIRARKKAEKAQRAKEQFLANMSHEIRTPMNGIMGLTRILRNSEVLPEQEEYLDAIMSSAENLLVIINDILDFSKIEAGKISFEKTTFNLIDLVKSIQKTLEVNASKKDIYLKTKIPKDIPEKMIGDPVRLNQILINLIGNAIKFTEKGGVTISIRSLEKNDSNITLRFDIKDTGIGIPPEKIESIFSSFSQASESTTRKYGGTGLGLTICKQLVELQGGLVWVTSQPGKGSTFSVQLSFSRADSKVEQLSSKKEDIDITKLENLEVLLVEDNPINQMLATTVLNGWKFSVDVAENGLVALDRFKSNNYDIILMDIHMPELDGFETTKRIRKEFRGLKKKIPIVAMTASALKGDNEKCLSAGMNDYISKPFDPDQLLEKIVTLIKPIAA